MPDVWESVLETTGQLSDSQGGGAVFSFSEGVPPNGRSVARLAPLLDEFISSDMWKSCNSAKRMLDMRPACFVQVDDFLSEEEILRDPIRMRLRAMGLESGLCTTVPMLSGETVTFIYLRATAKKSHSEAEIASLDRLRPHLARASLMAARLGLAEAQNAVAVMEKLGLPAAVLTAGRRVLAANALLAGLPGIFIPRAHGGLALPTSETDALLQAALTELASNAQAAVRSIPIPANESRPAMVVHALPLRRTARDIFSGGEVLIAATEIRPGRNEPPIGLLQGLFDLTPAEARLAAALTRGLTLGTAATQQGVTIKTARSYLENIFRKTGTGQQSQLVALLGAAQPFRLYESMPGN
ncbi:helix-turn-helix transcriptional regulator [Taklimakanibacter lacteus]|uniref:helix-turn-helix transcriptional regulator n=1 Tax=Taklimakanibacter lacteus TaxID=2268456 RepID=UPI0034D51AD1